MIIKTHSMKKKSINKLGTLIVGLCMGAASHADPITHTITETGVDWGSAGISGVGDGTGSITLSGISGTVGTARLFWHGIDNGVDGNYDNATVTINGNEVVGAAIGTATTNCWGPGNSVSYRADVTAFVNGNGAYTIAGMSAGSGHSANGASIVVTFDDGDGANDRDLAYFEGNDSNLPQGFPGEDDGWHAMLESINYDGTSTVGIQFHAADGQNFSDAALTIASANGNVIISDDATLWDGISLPDAGTSRADNGGLYDIHDFDITAAFGGVAGSATLNLDGQLFSGDCLGLVLALVDLPAGALPGPEDFSKAITDGPDMDGDGNIDVVIGVKQTTATAYQWKINYNQPEAVLITDTAPAESVVTAVNGDDFGLPLACGDATDFADESGYVDVYRGGKSGKSCRSATQFDWTPDTNNEMLVVNVEMRQSPGKGHKEPAYAPTSCGALYLNNGAKAYKLDPSTGEPLIDIFGERLPPIYESNQLCVAAVKDPTAFGPDADNDGDGIYDFDEACNNVVRTDPCLADTDGDGVIDGLDLCPLEGNADTDAGQTLGMDGCIIDPI